MAPERDSAPLVVFVRGAFKPHGDAVSRSLVELVIELQRRGVTCRIFCATVPRATPLVTRMAPGTVVPLGPRRGTAPYTGRARVRFVASAAWRLLTLPGRVDAVVTLEDPTAVGLVGALARRLRRDRPRHVSWLMDLQSVQHLRLALPGRRRELANRTRVRLDALSWRVAGQVVVLGSCMADVVTEVAPGSRVAIIPIWQDGARLQRRPGSPPAATGTADLTVMYHGHATHRQPMDDVAAAARDLAADGEGGGVRFLVVGNGPAVERLRAEAHRDGLANVQVTPDLPDLDLPDVLALGDVHLAILDDRATGTCVPSKTYTAMALGRPCIFVGGTEGQAARDVREARAGFTVPLGEPGELAERVRRLRDDAHLRAELGSNGHAFFTKERDLPRIADRWAELLTR